MQVTSKLKIIIYNVHYNIFGYKTDFNKFKCELKT